MTHNPQGWLPLKSCLTVSLTLVPLSFQEITDQVTSEHRFRRDTRLSAEKPLHTRHRAAIRQSQGARYFIRLDEMTIRNTRAPHEDTDVLAFGLKVGDKVFDTQVMSFGDVNNGRHAVHNNNPTGSCAKVCQFGPIYVEDAWPVIFNYVVVNKEGGATTATKRKVTDASVGLLTGAKFNLDAPKDDFEIPKSQWEAAYQGLKQFYNVLFGGCDGPVIVDQVQVTGKILFDKTENPDRAYTEERPYDGTDSMTGCGSNSKYSMKWTILRQ